MTPKLTPEAEAVWAAVSHRHKTLILNNVWCTACRRGTTMVLLSGYVESGDLILEGECERCGAEVARLVEGEDFSGSPPSS